MGDFWDDVAKGIHMLPIPGKVMDAVGIGPDAHAGEDQANQLADLYDNLKYQDPSTNPDYAANLKLLQTYAKGTLTPEDRAREYEALGEAEKFAAGESGAIAQDAAARGGGGAGVNSVRQQVAAQGSAKRLGAADIAVAGDAAKRAFAAQQEFARQMQINSQMQQQFAEWKAGGQAAGIKNLQDLKEREAAAQSANRDSLINSVAGMGLAIGTGGASLPGTAARSAIASSTAAPPPSPSPTVGSATPTSATDFGATPTTADAAAKAYAASLPFAQMATPGSAPSVASDDPRKRFP